MSYTVLARKYRPQRFDELVGQEHIAKTIKNAIAKNRIHHAFLFTGVRGIGKTTTARILAKAMCCAEAPVEEPCNKCASCLAITAGNSTDVYEIDGASKSKVEDIRDLQETIHFTPSVGKYRVYIIDEVHMLSTSAFNALLKTLEEPPAHVKFIFATTEAHKLPATILSRVQRYDFKKCGVRLMVDHLKGIVEREGLSVPEEVLWLAAREGGGSVRDSLSLLDQALAAAGETITEEEARRILGVSDMSAMLDLSEAVITGDSQRAIKLYRELGEIGYDLRHFLTELATQFRNLAVAVALPHPEEALEMTASEAERLKKVAAKASKDQILRIFGVFSEASESISRSPFPQMALEVLLLRLCEIKPVLPINELVEKLGSYAFNPYNGARQPQNTAASAVPAQRQAFPSAQAPSRQPSLQREHKTAQPAMEISAPTWEAFVAFVENKLPFYGSMLFNAAPALFTPQKIQIKLTMADYANASALGDKFVNEMKSAAREFFGRDDVDFSIKGADASASAEKKTENAGLTGEKSAETEDGSGASASKSLAEIEEEARRKRFIRIEREVSESKAIKKIKELFGEETVVDVIVSDAKN